MPNKEMDDFLKDIPGQENQEDEIFKQANGENTPEEEVIEPKVDEEKPHRNRQNRRFEARLLEREKELIAREARQEALSESRQFSQETGVDERLVRLYGNTEEGKEAARLHMDLLKDERAKARQEALEDLRAERQKEAAQVKEYESLIDSEFETIEDEYNVDLTSNAPAAKKARANLIEMVKKLSPKDAEGNVTAYADFGAAWEIIQSQKERPSNSRQKELSDRSMTQSGPVNLPKEEADQQLAYLRSVGIRV